MAEKKNKFSAMSLKKLEGMLGDGSDQLMAAEELLYHFLEDEVYNPWLLSTLCDIYSANYKLVSEIEGVMENCYIDKEESDERLWKIILSPEDVMILETIMVARYYTGREISAKCNLSLSIH